MEKKDKILASEFHIRGKVKTYLLYLKCMKNLLLSHHPNCDTFDNHTINIGKNTRLCIGCFVGYPVAIFGIVIIYLLNLGEIFNSTFFFTIGMMLLSFFILSPLNLTKIKAIKIIQKILIGIGSAFLFWWVWSTSNPFIINFMYFLMVFGLLLTLLNAYHVYGFYNTCKKCDTPFDWEDCPGFQDVSNCFKEHDLKNILKSPK